MNCRIFPKSGGFIDVEAEPECGDYCDACGDCLACEPGSVCHRADDDGPHAWVINETENPERAAQLLATPSNG